MKFPFTFTILLLLSSCATQQTSTQDQTTETQVIATDESINAFCTETLTESPNLPAGDVLNLVQSKEGDPIAYDFAIENGAELIPVDDDKSFAVWWEPENFDASTGTVLVSLHGHASWSVKGFEVWYPQITERNIAFLGLQWWFGRSLENEGYYEPDQIYRLIAEQLEAKGITPGNVIFEGFSMGSARSYGVSLYDHLCDENYFGVNIANAGAWEDGYPLYSEILTKQYGDQPFEGTSWILFCGEEDENEFATTKVTHVCDGMENTKQRLEDMGANVVLFIKDPTGDHGSFNLNDENENTAMDKAEAVLEDN